MQNFNLIDDPCIPIIVAGVQRDMSIRGVFASAQDIDLSLANPLEAVALLRQLLIPITLRALGAPRNEDEWADMFEGPDLGRIDAYLDDVHEGFFLFGDRPIAQVAGLQAVSGDTKPSSLLRADLATGNNVPLFTERTESTPPALTPPQAARALLATQCFDTAAIKTGAVGDPLVKQGKTTGNPTGPVGALGVVVPWGRNLWETLVLNCLIIPAGLRPADLPQWEQQSQDASWAKRPPLGLLDLLTWQSRRIRLIPSDQDGETVVRSVVVSAGDRLTDIPTDLEIHTLWQPSDVKRTGVAQRPRRHQPGRSAWRGLASILAVGSDSSLLISQMGRALVSGVLPGGLLPQVVTVGVVYGNQSAVVEDVLVDSIPLPLQALLEGSDSFEAVTAMVSRAEKLREAANHLHDDIRRAAGAEPISWDKGSRAGDILLADIDATTRRFLRGLQRQPDAADELLEAWSIEVRRTAGDVAESLQQAAPPTTFLGREFRNRRYRLTNVVSLYYHQVKQILGEHQKAGSA